MRNLKVRLTSVFVIIFTLEINCQIQSYTDFITYLKDTNLSYKAPDNFHEYLPAKYHQIFFERTSFSSIFQIKSEDENILLDYLAVAYDKTAENKINALYPNRNVDLRKNYLYIIMSIDPWIYGKQSDTSLLKSKINYYDAKTNEQLGSELSGEYLITLDKPYKNEYKYMTVRFMTKYYKIWVFTFIFYKTINEEIINNCRKQTLYSLIINK